MLCFVLQDETACEQPKDDTSPKLVAVEKSVDTPPMPFLIKLPSSSSGWDEVAEAAKSTTSRAEWAFRLVDEGRRTAESSSVMTGFAPPPPPKRPRACEEQPEGAVAL